MDIQDRLSLTVTEAARVLGISRALAYDLVARGELPSLRLGRRLVVPRKALDALLEGGVAGRGIDALLTARSQLPKRARHRCRLSWWRLVRLRLNR